MFEKDKHFGHIILECLKQRPDSICQIDAATGEEETNASALRRSIRLARCLRRLGLVPGDVIALCGKNHLDQQIPYFAALMNGLPINGVDPFVNVGKLSETHKLRGGVIFLKELPLTPAGKLSKGKLEKLAYSIKVAKNMPEQKFF